MSLKRRLLAVGSGLVLLVGGSSVLTASGAVAARGALAAPKPPLVEEAYVSLPVRCSVLGSGLAPTSDFNQVTVAFKSKCGVPTDALAVNADFSVSGTFSSGAVKAFAAGTAEPLSPTLVFTSGQDATSATDVTLCSKACAAGKDVQVTSTGSAAVFAIAVNGYYVKADTTAFDLLTKRVLTLETGLKALATTVGQLTTDVTTLTTAVGKLKTAVGDPYANPHSLDTRVGTLETAPAPIRIMNSRINADGTIVGGDAVPDSVDSMTKVGSVKHAAASGIYTVKFQLPNIENCTFQATSRETTYHAVVSLGQADQTVTVNTLNFMNANVDSMFNLTGTCTK
ncbi:MAG: hypothetical protein JWN46_1685 [Acidimicrobiales bacterium]|nr:hypothetical protein [Acidimicrobiales bacterium]